MPRIEPYLAACAQLQIGTDPAANLATCLDAVDRAAAGGARLVVLPELCNHPGPFANREEAWAAGEPEGGPFHQAMAERARRHDVFIAYNLLEQAERPKTFITTYLVDPAGMIVQRFSKHFLFGAQADWTAPGERPLSVVPTAIGQVGLYICMDGLIPETTRVLQVLGAQVMINPLNSAGPDEADLHVPARAVETRAWVLSANKVGQFAGTHAPNYAGGSEIVAPDGMIVARASDEREEIIYGTIDPRLADDKAAGDSGDLLADRRPEAYAAMPEPNEGLPAYRQPQAPERIVRLAAVQCSAGDDEGDPLEAALALARQAAQGGAQLAVLSEAFLWRRGTVAEGPAAAAQESSRAVDAFATLARETGLLAALNVVEATDGRHYNAVCLIDRSGVVGYYRQVHLRQADHAWATAGDHFPVFETPLGRLGLMLGYDGLFPEAARTLALHGAEAILWPCDWRLAYEPALISIERAAENHVAVVAANRQDSPVAAGSQVIAAVRYPTQPHWKMRFPEAVDVPHGVRDFGIVPVDLGATAVKLVAYKTDLVADRRPEHYGVLAAGAVVRKRVIGEGTEC